VSQSDIPSIIRSEREGTANRQGPRLLPKGAPPACSVLWSGAVVPNLCKASRPTLYKNLNDGMSQCDSAGLHLLPFLKGEKEYLVLIKCNYDTVWAGERVGVRGSEHRCLRHKMNFKIYQTDL